MTFDPSALAQATVDVKNVAENPIEAAAQIIDQAAALTYSYAIIRALVRCVLMEHFVTGPEIVLTRAELADPSKALDLSFNDQGDATLKLVDP